MPITTTVVGSYPKPPHEGRPFRLRRAIAAFERGEIGAPELRKVEDDLAEEVLAEHVAAGIDLVTDGQVRWTDPVTPFARKLGGFLAAHEDLIRFFDNNTYYRRPHVTGRVEWGGPVTVQDWDFASSLTDATVKQAIIGPYSLAKLSKNEHYSHEGDLVLDIARVLNQEAFELEAAGCTWIQFDEPAIVAHPNLADEPKDFGLLSEASAVLTEGLSVTTELRTYFGGVEEAAGEFFSLPFKAFGLDFVDGPSNWDLVKELPGDRTLSAGLLNGRDTRLEPSEALREQVERLLGLVSPDRLRLSPSCGLEYLPRDRAEAKLRRLVRAAKSTNERMEA